MHGRLAAATAAILSLACRSLHTSVDVQIAARVMSHWSFSTKLHPDQLHYTPPVLYAWSIDHRFSNFYFDKFYFDKVAPYTRAREPSKRGTGKRILKLQILFRQSRAVHLHNAIHHSECHNALSSGRACIMPYITVRDTFLGCQHL